MAQQIDLLKNTSFEDKMDSLIEAVLKGENYNYAQLTNKPSINGYTLEGNKTNAQLGIPTKTSDITNDSGFVEDKNYVHTDENFTSAEKTKLGGISDGAEANVQANWSETDPMEDSFIKNKPTIPSKTSDLTNDSNYVVDSDYKHTDNNYTTADKNSVATIGNKVDKVEGKQLSTNDFTNDLKNKLSIAYDHSQKTSGNPHNVTKSDVGLDNVPNVSTNNQTPTFTKADSRDLPISGETLSTLFGKILKWFSDLKSVAFSGDYNDLTNQPTNATTNTNGLMSKDDKTKLDGIDSGANKTTVDSELNSTSTNPVQNKVINDALNNKLSTTGTAAKATADASGNTITTSYASTIEISGNTLTLKSKSGATLKSITLPSSQPTWS